MSDAFPHVFEPLRLRHRTLRSRITFGAHTANMAEDGLPGERHIGYYRERALGGAGMIVVEPVPVHRTGVLTRGNFRHDDDAIIPAFRRVTDACRDGEPGRRDDPPAVPRRPARRCRQLVRAELVAVRVALVPRRRRQPCDDRAPRSRSSSTGSSRRRGAPRRAASTGSRCSPPTTRSSTSSGRRGRTGGRDEWGGSFEDRMRFSAEILRRHPRALRRRLHHRAGGQRGSRRGRPHRGSTSWRRSSPGTTSAG